MPGPVDRGESALAQDTLDVVTGQFHASWLPLPYPSTSPGRRRRPAGDEARVAETSDTGTRSVLRTGEHAELVSLGVGHPAGGATEIGGVGTLPTARRQGLAAAVTTALAVDAREHGVTTVFLAYAAESVARLYARLGFRPAGVTLLIADQPARS
ncbi:GNAT family N-acetyltransferase [Streptomyces antibioticus]|uniref:GNAT family N-acetyltransferase n=1 Tax=Streptomyces antibioticus TaxID=1890 RepID=UPI00368C4DE6